MLRGDPDGVADVAAAVNRRRADEVDVASGSDLDLSGVVGNDAGLVGENSRLQEAEVRAIAYPELARPPHLRVRLVEVPEQLDDDADAPIKNVAATVGVPVQVLVFRLVECAGYGISRAHNEPLHLTLGVLADARSRHDVMLIGG